MPRSKNSSPVTRAGQATAEPLPGAFGHPLARATLKACPEDFRVEECLKTAFSRDGEHLWLYIEKRDRDTADVVAHLARAFGAHPRAIGYAGLKDRRAVARQWFSLPSALPADPASLATRFHTHDGIVLLEAVRHRRKLRRGTHNGNRFRLVIRDLRPLPCCARSHPAALPDAIAERLEAIRRSGFPNYVGPQRFGWQQRNLLEVRRLAERGARLPAGRLRRGLYLSAARSALFNRVCAARVSTGTWLRPLDGEPMVLAGSRSFFIGDGGTVLSRRLEAGDLHTSGPLPGAGDTAAEGACRRFEASLLAAEPALLRLLEHTGLKPMRRPLRALPTALGWHWLDSTTLVIEVELEKGVFATSLVAQLIDSDTHAR